MIDLKTNASTSADYSRCPIPAAHRRLVEAHLLWHQTLENYQQPDAFRANLNATIQALRNVTFALQSEKQCIANFDEWYGRWRAKLMTDPIARWLTEARNIVVKQGELEINSSAVVRVLTWKDDTLTESQVPPGASTGLILKNLPLLELLKGSEIPHGDLRHAALAVERRWSVEELRGQEILEALAHVYGLLSDLVVDAHVVLNRLVCIPVKSFHPDFRSAYHRTGVLECMAMGPEQRTERIELATGKHFHVESESPPDSPELLEKAAKRYGLRGYDRVPRWQESDPVVIAEKILYRAKQLLRKDKTHARMMFIRDGRGEWHQTILTAENRAEKHILMRVVASFIERVGADAVIDVAELWTLPEHAASELNNDLGSIEDAPSRGEALQVLVATREGILRTYTTPFSRGPFGGIKLADTHRSDGDYQPYYLTPVFDVWRRHGTHMRKDGRIVRQLWEPDPLDTCFCGGPKRFVECCKPMLEYVRAADRLGEEISAALQFAKFPRAEELARASLAQYVIWIKQHTAATRHVAHELHRDLIEVDVPALHVHVRYLREALAANGHSDALVPRLRHLSKTVGVPEIAVRLTSMAARFLWESGDTAAALDELKRLGNLDEVTDNLALVLATRLLELPSERVIELLGRAAGNGFSVGERVSAALELGKHYLKSGDTDSALRVVDTAISDAGSETDNRSALGDALSLRWEITRSEEDFRNAKGVLEALPPDQNWQDLASLLMDHGDYEDAEAAMASALKNGDLTAHLLAVDARLRMGKTAAARELLLAIPPDSVGPRLLYPYAYTTGLVALMSKDPELKLIATSRLREVVAVDTPVIKPAKDLLAALEDPSASERSSVLDRLRAFAMRKRSST